MTISNTVGSSPTFGQVSATNFSNKASSPIKESGYSAAPEKVVEEQSSPKQSTPNIVIDEQAIALFKEQQAAQQAFTGHDHNNHSAASHDQPSLKNETAVANYQAVGNLAERESVQKLFGVDLFA